MPIGFKNGTGGSIKMAVDAIISAKYPHSFLGINLENNSSIIKTKGNQNCHIILRGGSSGPNYDENSIKNVIDLMEVNNVKPNIMVDCSHGNSQKDYRNQQMVVENILEQINKTKGNKKIKGIMLESNIYEGKQEITSNLNYGVSITDSCISLETTNSIFEYLNNFIKI